jgi:hypothetical protein
MSNYLRRIVQNLRDPQWVQRELLLYWDAWITISVWGAWAIANIGVSGGRCVRDGGAVAASRICRD